MAGKIIKPGMASAAPAPMLLPTGPIGVPHVNMEKPSPGRTQNFNNGAIEANPHTNGISMRGAEADTPLEDAGGAAAAEGAAAPEEVAALAAL